MILADIPVRNPGNIGSYYLHFNREQVIPEHEAPLHRVACFNADERALALEFKMANPKIICLAYKCNRLQSSADFPTGVPYSFALQNHPEWFARDILGNRIEWTDYRFHFQARVDLPDYQEAWATQVIFDMGTPGLPWDGVIADNILTERAYGIGRCPAFDTDTKVYSAYESFVAFVAARLETNGLLFIPNIREPRWNMQVWDHLTHLPGVAGASWEHFTRWDDNTTLDNSWSGGWPSDFNAAALASDRLFLGKVGGDPNPASLAYGIGTALLTNTGRACVTQGGRDAGSSHDPILGLKFGQEIESRTVIGSLQHRKFERAWLVVNPTKTPVVMSIGTTALKDSFTGLSYANYATVPALSAMALR